MRYKQIIVLVIVLIILAVIGWCLWRVWPSRGKVEKAMIDLYIKIFCER